MIPSEWDKGDLINQAVGFFGDKGFVIKPAILTNRPSLAAMMQAQGKEESILYV